MIVGLTGGIGSGKSTVARLFEQMGAAIFNSDAAAKACYFDASVKDKVIHLLGSEAYQSATAINKSYISEKIFHNTTLLQQLNAIIHPAVKASMASFVAQHANQLVLKETALLFEANLTEGLDKIIVVAAPDELRIQRCMQRDGVSREQVEVRMKAQLPQEKKIAKADFVIYNDEQHSVIEQVLQVIKQLKS